MMVDGGLRSFRMTAKDRVGLLGAVAVIFAV